MVVAVLRCLGEAGVELRFMVVSLVKVIARQYHALFHRTFRVSIVDDPLTTRLRLFHVLLLGPLLSFLL